MFLKVRESVIPANQQLDPQAAWNFAPHNQRMQQSIPPASKLASGIAADPRRLCFNYWKVIDPIP